MTPIDPRTYCPQHAMLTQQVGTLLVETTKQTGKLAEIHQDVLIHKTEHAADEKSKAKWRWIVPLLLTLALFALGAAFGAGRLLTAQPQQPQVDVKAIAAAVVAAQKGQP